MKTRLILSVIGILIVLVALDFGFGYLGVFKTKTVVKAQENARREVFEVTQSYIEGKRQEAAKYRLEYMRSDDPSEKEAIRSTIAQSFANFDENLLPKELRDFVYVMKYE